MRNLLSLTVLALALAGVSCTSSPSITSPTPPSLAGTWVGSATITGSAAGTGTIRATIAQTGNALTGTWGSTYANPANNGSGALTGTTNGAAVSLTLNSSVPTACPYNVTGTLSGTTSISGTFATFNCSVSASGPFVLTKQ